MAILLGNQIFKGDNEYTLLNAPLDTTIELRSEESIEYCITDSSDTSVPSSVVGKLIRFNGDTFKVKSGAFKVWIKADSITTMVWETG